MDGDCSQRSSGKLISRTRRGAYLRFLRKSEVRVKLKKPKGAAIPGVPVAAPPWGARFELPSSLVSVVPVVLVVLVLSIDLVCILVIGAQQLQAVTLDLSDGYAARIQPDTNCA